MAYPNENCNQCDPTPPVEVNTLPACTGEPCAEAYPTLCVKYNGPEIPDFNIVPGINMNEIITIITEVLLNCPDIVEYTGVASQTECDKITITITNPLTSVDLYYVAYKKNTDIAWTVVTGIEAGQYIIDITGLDGNTLYDIEVYKICGPGGCNSQSVTSQITTSICTQPI